jgi:protein-tyrosine-phosphatase
LPLRDLIAWIPGVRPAARHGRRLRDRLLHPWRRREALATVRRTRSARRIVVLCLGNINRSPFAAALLRRGLQEAGDAAREVLSAGFIGPGRPSPPQAVALAAARGLDLSDHESRLVTREIVRDAGLVIVMNTVQARNVAREHGARASRVVILGDLDDVLLETREIRDPYDQAPAVYEASFARVERCVSVIVEELGRSRRRVAG